MCREASLLAALAVAVLLAAALAFAAARQAAYPNARYGGIRSGVELSREGGISGYGHTGVERVVDADGTKHFEVVTGGTGDDNPENGRAAGVAAGAVKVAMALSGEDVGVKEGIRPVCEAWARSGVTATSKARSRKATSSKPTPSRFAYVFATYGSTLFYAGADGCPLCTAVSSLLCTKPLYSVIVMASTSVPEEELAPFRAITGVQTLRVSPLYAPKKCLDSLPTNQRRLGAAPTKLHYWNMTQYERIMVLDTDMLFLRNIDHLFDTNMGDAHFAASLNGCQGKPMSHESTQKRWSFNAGLLVAKPNAKTFAKLLAARSEVLKNCKNGFVEQKLLTTFFRKAMPTRDAPRLSQAYNCKMDLGLGCCSKDGIPLHVLHFSGRTVKPWLETKQTRKAYDSSHKGPLLGLFRELNDAFPMHGLRPRLAVGDTDFAAIAETGEETEAAKAATAAGKSALSHAERSSLRGGADVPTVEAARAGRHDAAILGHLKSPLAQAFMERIGVTQIRRSSVQQALVAALTAEEKVLLLKKLSFLAVLVPAESSSGMDAVARTGGAKRGGKEGKLHARSREASASPNSNEAAKVPRGTSSMLAQRPPETARQQPPATPF